MIEHLTEGTLQALLDGELDRDEAEAARSHLAACASCEAGYGELRVGALTFSAAASELDTRGRRGGAMPPARGAGRRRGLFLFEGSLRRAAILVLGFSAAAAAAAAMPGSPVRAWFAEEDRPSDGGVFVESPEATAATDVASSGVSVALEDGRLRIVIVRPAPDLSIRATITDSSRGGVYATGEAASAQFTSGVGLVEVVDASGGELLLEIPASATSATVELDGTLYLTKDGDQLRMQVAAGESAGAEVRFRPGQLP